MRVELFSGRDERVAIEQGGEGLRLRLSGTVDADFLSRTLDELHRETLARRLPGVMLDLCDLDPLEPAAVKAMIKWAMRQAELDASERYGIVIRYSEGVSWQKVSLSAIAHLCGYVRLDPGA